MKTICSGKDTDVVIKEVLEEEEKEYQEVEKKYNKLFKEGE